MTTNSRADEPNLIDEPGYEHILRVFLFAIIASALAVSALTLLLGWPRVPEIALAAAVSTLVALVLSRSGRIRPAMFLALLAITYAVMHVAAWNDGVQSIGLAIVPVLIVVCSLLLDRLLLVLFTALAILAAFGMLAIRYFVLRVERYSTNDMGDCFIFALTCATTAVLGRLLAMRIKEDSRRVRDSESRYRRIFESVQDVYYEMRADGILLEVSPASAALFGVSPEEMIGRPLASFCMNPSEFDALLAALHTRGWVSNRDLVIRDSAAVHHHVLVSASLQTANAGVERVIGSIRDITERKGLEEELRRRAEELQKIMDVAPVALFVANDPECREVIVNREGNALLEVPGGATPPCPFLRDGIEIPIHELPLQTAARGVEVRDCELEVLLPSGKRRSLWGHATPLRDAAGQVRGAIAAVQDVTEIRQRTDAILRESEERFRKMADATPIIMWFGDWTGEPQTRVSFFNSQAADFTGLSVEQLLGEGWAQVIHPDDLEVARRVYWESAEKHVNGQVEYRVRRADGEYRHVLGTISPRYVGDVYAGQVGTVIDITDLKREQEGEFARQKLESVGTLASGIAHDFNNLLGGVLAQADLALEEFDAGSSPKEELMGIREVAIRGSDIVRQLMIYAGKETESVGLVDVSRIIEEMLKLLKVSISKRAVLKTNLPKDLPAVRANATQIRQIVMNLVMNASDAIGDRDGVIRVTTERMTVGRDAAISGYSGESHYVQLEVSDTGCGMSQETQAKVFDPFFTNKSAGHGLGLAVVHGIVRGLRGSIHLTSEPGKGTTFKVLLPCDQGKAAATSEEMSGAEQSAHPFQAFTVLVVEDEDPLRQAVCKMLRKKGFEVLEAANGSAAIDLMRASGDKIDVMLLDMTIPGASSHEVLAEAVKARPDIKVILTSAYSQEMLRPPLSASQIRGFVRKPFQLGNLVQTLQNAFAS